jgi:TrmH family RNA methyltransferase
MISKNRIKLIRSLQLKKYRQKYNKFICEGGKISEEVLRDSPELIDTLYGTDRFVEKLQDSSSVAVEIVTENELKSISALDVNHDCLLICNIPEQSKEPDRLPKMTFYLDNVRDPGNLGTIMRLCDWFGMHTLFLSEGCADHFNPKVIQASMGSFLRIKIIKETFDKTRNRYLSGNIAIADLRGKDYRSYEPTDPLLVVLGNESNGVSSDISSKIENRITIPGASHRVESLNVAVSASILAAHFASF